MAKNYIGSETEKGKFEKKLGWGIDNKRKPVYANITQGIQGRKRHSGKNLELEKRIDNNEDTQ